MPKYKYTARNKKGEVIHDEMDASSEQEVAEFLRKDKFWPTSIKKKEKKKKKSSFLQARVSVPLKSKMIFCRHLAVMIASGLSLSKGLFILSSQERSKSFKKVIERLSVDVKKGQSFAGALQSYPKIFSPVFVSMINMGELSGNLEEVLKILSNQLEKDHKLVSKVRGAMIYPAIVIGVMIVIGILSMIFIVPKIRGIFEGFGAELPLATRIIIGVSDFMVANPLPLFSGVVIVFFGLREFAKRESGKKFFHKLFLKLPVIGSIVQKVNSARFSRILSSLLKSGTSLVESLEITADTLKNYYFKKAIIRAADEVQKGVVLSEIFEKEKNLFPYLVVQMLEVGEETGETPEILLKLAVFFEEEVDQVTKNISSIIEPVLMIVIGIAVAVFAIAIIQPIYSMMEGV